ncbi:MAG TPA: AraC family transcriptional regulator [Cyclobacteriaceae bacterium]|jgi:AraC-like DNA-binding protein
MSSVHKYIAVSNPDIPLLRSESNPDPRMGVLTDVSGLMTRSFDPNDLPNGYEAHLHDIYLPNATVRTYRGKFAYNVRLVTESGTNGENVGSCLFLDGKMTTVLDGKSRGVVISKGQQNFKYDPNREFSHWGDADTSYHILHFSIDPKYFISFLPQDEAWADNLMNRIMRRERIIGDSPAYISLQQHKAIQNLFDCPMSGKMAQILMETSVVQIVLWQLHALFRDSESMRPSKVAARDRDVAIALKEYLNATFLEDHSLVSLARHFAVNSNKLMFLFKNVFGISIFEYISDMKMEYAMRLIRDDRKFVTEAARILGYKNPHHFSAAFKKKFGICPSAVK